MPLLKKNKDKADIFANVMSRMPDSLTPEEVSAFVMGTVHAYMGDDVSAALSTLITSTIVYAKAVGIPDDRIAQALIGCADHVLSENQGPKYTIN